MMATDDVHFVILSAVIAISASYIVLNHLALRESEERYRRLVDLSPEAIFIYSGEKFIYVNPAGLKLYGFATREEIEGKPLLDVIHPDCWEISKARIQQLKKGEKQNEFELKILRPDGQVISVEAIGAPLSYQGKRAWLVFTRDIRERKRSEEELRESKQGIVNIIESITDAFFALDHQWRFTYVNHHAEQLLQGTREELLGRNFWEKFPEAISLSFYREYHKAVLEQVSVEFEEFYPPLNQWLQVHAYPSLDGLSVYFTDITERKQVEEKIKKLNQDLKCRASELEAANSDLESFSYSVSHDLRAPLRAIDGFSRILLKEYAPQLAPEARRYLHMVADNAQQMGCLVDDLLTFSRLGRSALKKQRFQPENLVRGAIANLRPAQENRQVEILLSELPVCEADPALLKQVWVNLLANALKFTRPREVARIEVGYQLLDSENVYFVKDNGVGFDMQYAHQLFGVFQRLHRAEEYEGTGVGLAIVQRVIHRHGGRVWAAAQVNIGATFYFTLGKDIYHDTDYFTLGGDVADDADCGRNPVSGRQPQRRGIDTPLLEKQ